MPLRAYTTTLSVRWGDVFRLHAANDAEWADLAGVSWSIDAVADLRAPGSPGVGSNLASGSFTAPRFPAAAIEARYSDREATGYDYQEVASYSVPPNTPPGLYVATVTSGNQASLVYFLIRAATRRGAILLCWPWSTTLAYAGGGADDATTLYSSYHALRGRRVSLDRPLDSFVYGDRREHTHVSPFNLARFLKATFPSEPVDHCTSFDLHAEKDILQGYTLFISVGHDEYWSKEMRDHVEDFVKGGGNAAFFSANTAWWHVRIDMTARTMTCHKSVIEDPAAGADNPHITSNPASSPIDRPENLMTGVSFRRGMMSDKSGPTQLTLRVDPGGDPFLANVGLKVGDGFPDYAKTPVGYSQNNGYKLVQHETDAIDVDPNTLKATGLDGSPLGFVVLCDAGSPPDQKGGKVGKATLGYSKNGGTVFTAACTEWANWLADATVAQITTNVISVLKSPQVMAAPAYLWRTFPTSQWRTIDWPSGAEVICALDAGKLLLQSAASNELTERDPEALTPWSVPSDKTPKDLPDGLTQGRPTAMAARLYSDKLFATSSTIAPAILTREKVLIQKMYQWQSWTKQSVIPPLGVKPTYYNGIAVSNAGIDLFLLTSNQELLASSNSLVMALLGPVQPGMRTITECDGHLFGAGVDGTLYCRTAVPVDLVWSACGSTVPAFSMTAYFGRLFALAFAKSKAGPGIALHWRTATADAPIDRHVLFCHRVANAWHFALAVVSGFGAVRTTGGGAVPSAVSPNVDQPWLWHVVRIGGSRVLFHNHASGQGFLVRFNRDGAFTIDGTPNLGPWSSWTHAGRANTKLSYVCRYALGEASAQIGSFDAAGNFTLTDTVGGGPWTHVAATWRGDLLFYKGDVGSAAWGVVDSAGRLTQRSYAAGFSTGWEQIVPFGNACLLFYDSQTGNCAVGRVDGNVFTSRIAGGSAPYWSWILPRRVLVPAGNGLVVMLGEAGEADVIGLQEIAAETPSTGTVPILRHYPEESFADFWSHFAALDILP